MFHNDHQKTEDKLLLEQLRESNSKAFDVLYEKYWERVYMDALNRLRDPAYAKDITQDIFLKLWTRRKEVVIDNLPAYLFTAVRNNVFKWLERERKYIPVSGLLHELETTRDKADAELLRKELMTAYQSLFAAFTPSQKVIFNMYHRQDLSTSDIAYRLNISRKTVQNQLGRCMARLRQTLLFFCYFLLFVLL